MSVKRFTPLGTRLLQFILHNHSIVKKYKHLPQVKPLYSKIFSISLGLAFVWPVKRNVIKDNDHVDDISLLLSNADNLYENGHYEQCHLLLTSYEKALNVEVQWRICRVLYNLSKDTKIDGLKKKELILQAYKIIENLLSSDEQHFAVQKWYALILDAKSSLDGMKERIKQLENVKKHMDLAVTLNPQDATILHMLGEWCYQISELSWHNRKLAEILFATPPKSTYEDALEYFLRAEAVQPRFYSLNLLRLGSCYLKLKKEDQAKYYLNLAASYPAKSNDDHRANKEAAELLKKLK